MGGRVVLSFDETGVWIQQSLLYSPAGLDCVTFFYAHLNKLSRKVPLGCSGVNLAKHCLADKERGRSCTKTFYVKNVSNGSCQTL